MKTSTPTHRGLGITAGLDAGLARDLAARCEHLGYHSLWSNDEPAASGLETLAHLAAGAPKLELGVGVLPLDRHPPTRIATEIDRLGIDPAKLWLGLGSGQLRSQIDPLRRAVAVVLQRFWISSDQEDVPLDTEGITLRPKGAVPIRLAAR